MDNDNSALNLFVLFLLGMCILTVILWCCDFTIGNFYDALDLSLGIK